MASYICKKCGVEKDENEFSPHPTSKYGRDLTKCKACNKAREDWKKVPLNKKILHRIKHRAKARGIEFNLELEDIILPDVCPVFNRPFVYGDIDWTYSVDRMDNSKGYIKGNIVIMSNRANRLKGDFTIEELSIMLSYLKQEI